MEKTKQQPVLNVEQWGDQLTEDPRSLAALAGDENVQAAVREQVINAQIVAMPTS